MNMHYEIVTHYPHVEDRTGRYINAAQFHEIVRGMFDPDESIYYDNADEVMVKNDGLKKIGFSGMLISSGMIAGGEGTHPVANFNIVIGDMPEVYTPSPYEMRLVDYEGDMIEVIDSLTINIESPMQAKAILDRLYQAGELNYKIVTSAVSDILAINGEMVATRQLGVKITGFPSIDHLYLLVGMFQVIDTDVEDGDDNLIADCYVTYSPPVQKSSGGAS